MTELRIAGSFRSYREELVRGDSEVMLLARKPLVPTPGLTASNHAKSPRCWIEEEVCRGVGYQRRA